MTRRHLKTKSKFLILVKIMFMWHDFNKQNRMKIMTL